MQRHPSQTLLILSVALACYAASALSQSLFSLHAPAESAHAADSQRCGNSLAGERFGRTELFLGLSRADGTLVSNQEFQHFVDTEVTPRFPDGFTVIAGNGQFKDARGVLVREAARVLVVLYPVGDRRAAAAVESIRDAYKAAHRQESVLRVDDEPCASF